MTTKLWTVNDIKTANRVRGGHWFDPSSMRFFGTRVLPEVYQGPGGVFFVTSDKAGPRPESGRGYTVRTFYPESGNVGTAGGEELAEYRGKAAAVAQAKRLAAGEAGPEAVEVKAEEFQPVSVLEQFVHDLRTHARPDASAAVAREMIRLAKRHHRYMEAQCNGDWPYRDHNGEDGHPAIVERCRQALRDLAISVGCAEVVFSGDPRGATVRLRFADGATNDFGSEGWIVPTSEKDEG